MRSRLRTLGASTEQNKGFTVQYSPFFRLFITKNGSEAYFKFKKALSNFKRALLDNGQDAPETASRRSCHCVGM